MQGSAFSLPSCVTACQLVPLNTSSRPLVNGVLCTHAPKYHRGTAAIFGSTLSGAPLGLPVLNLALTEPLLITTYSADHRGLQWMVSSYRRCCCISPMRQTTQGECGRSFTVTGNNLVNWFSMFTNDYIVCLLLVPACVAYLFTALA